MGRFQTLEKRARCAGREKLWIGGAVGMACTIMYRLFQYHSWRPVAVRDACAGWDLLPFSTAWIWPYVSMFALVGLAWLALPDRRSVRAFAATMIAMAAVGWLCFWAWPTGCVRPVLADPPLAYRWLVALDRPTNCFPCLHSAFSIFAAAVVAQQWGVRLAWFILGAWAAVIAVSIVALRQHTDWDTLTGVGLGAMGAWFYTHRSIKG